MKKIQSVLLIFFLTGSLLACKKDRTGYDNRKIYFSVHKRPNLTTKYTYDPNGRLTAETHIDARGNTESRYVYSLFNTVGLPGRVDFELPASPMEKEYYIFEYDGQNRPVKCNQHMTNGTLRGYSTFNYLSNRIEIISFNMAGRQLYLNVYSFGSTGNINSVELFGPDNVIIWKINYTRYDEKKAPAHPLKYLALVLIEDSNSISVNNYTAYETYSRTILDARYSINYQYNEYGYASSRVVTDVLSNVSTEELFEFEKK